MYTNWIKLGLSKGITDLEIYAVKNRSLKLSVYQNKLDQHVQSQVEYVTIRGIYQNKLSTVRFENLSDTNVSKMLDQLIENAKALTVVEPAIIYEGSPSYPEVHEELFDFQSVPVIDKINLLKNLEQNILACPDVSQVQTTMYQEVEAKTALVNSKGLNLSRHQSYAYAYAIGVFKRGEADIQTAYDIKLAKKFSEFNPTEMAKTTIDLGVAKLGGKTIKTGSYPVVFNNEMFSDMLNVFSSIFSGEAAFRNMTPLKTKVGEKIFDSKVNLVNDPLHQDAFFKLPFDDEGVACQKRHVIKDGVFTGFNHSLKTAKIFNTAPTGNSFGSSIQMANFVLEPGTKGFEELIKDIEDGVLITDLVGLHAGVKTVSGEFSLQAAGQKIEHGKIAFPVKMIVVSGNFFDMMNHVVGIGSDLKFNLSGVASPSVHIESLMIGGE
jgi:PmbA protein